MTTDKPKRLCADCAKTIPDSRHMRLRKTPEGREWQPVCARCNKARLQRACENSPRLLVLKRVIAYLRETKADPALIAEMVKAIE